MGSLGKRHMKHQLYFGVALAALSFSSAAFAQSTGSVDFDESTIIVTATTTKGVGGVQVPDTTRAKGVLTQERISRVTPGQSILDTINQLPGVSFQNNDPFGSAGGTLNIRGFDASRISLTFDGIPLNDTGNYAIYSNQQLDPELIENVNVNYGSTDIDSPSAAASGSTVNYRTRNPSDEFGVRLQGSAGDFNFFRVFGMIDTGVFTSVGTKAFVSVSNATNNWYVNNFGKINKQQINGKIYQPIGSNGDFISIAGNYNENRNNFGGSAPLRSDTNIFSQSTAAPNSTTNPAFVTGAVRTAGTGGTNRFPNGFNEIPYNVPRGQTVNGVFETVAQVTAPGYIDPDAPNTVGTTFDERYNPSNTGSIRLNSRFTLADGLVLTVDPSFQYVKANGGGTIAAREFLRDVNPAGATAGTTNTANCTSVTTGAGVLCRVGYFAGNPFVGVDLNGDGDLLDNVTVLAPSQTQTRRYGVIASLRYDIAQGQTLRLGYTFDRGRHRQTGEINRIQQNGVPTDVFPVNGPIAGANSQILQKRDRLSYATLNRISGEYQGRFIDGKLIVNVGVAVPFFQRDLNQNCFTSSAGGFVECFGRDATLQGEIAAANPYVLNTTTGNPVAGSFAPPGARTYKYNRVLPSAGFIFKPADHFSVAFNYSKGLQVPGTDNLYNAFYFPRASAGANPVPETTDNFDLNFRYTSSTIQASIGPWYTRFTNRLASAFDVDTQQTIYRNLGRVDKYGIDANISVIPVPGIMVSAFGSYLQSEIKDNVQLGFCPTTLTTANTTVNCTVAGAPILALTAGKRESGAPTYTFGGRIQGTVGPVDLGLTAKRTGQRFINDQNLPLIQCTSGLVNTICPTAANTPVTFTGTRGFQYQIYGASAPAYTLVDFDARVNLEFVGLKKTHLQLNVQNVFNQFYVGGFNGGSTVVTSVPFVQIGVPRTFIGTLNVQF